MLTSLVPPKGKVLVLVNGAYGLRAKRILDIAGRKTVVHQTAEDAPPDLKKVEAILKRTPSITHVFAVHCETTSGILNPVEEIGALAAQYGKGYLIDSMSAFGAVPLDARAVRADAITASSNKCIEGVPGLGFVICRRAALEASQGNATTLVLDLHDSGPISRKRGNTASRRRRTSSSRCIRRCRNSRRRAACRVAAGVTGTIAASCSTAWRRSDSSPCWRRTCRRRSS
jgi:2-aminoethylphosphonate-pyruvate transaminase